MSKYPQKATYWAPSTLNEFGEQSFLAPVEIDTRWEDKTVLHIDMTTGKERRSEAILYLDSLISINGFIFKGISTDTNPRDVDKAYLVRSFEDMTDIKGRKHTRKVWL